MWARAIHDAGLRQVVPLAQGEVVGIVRGGDLDGTGAELRVGPVVAHDGDAAGGFAGELAEREGQLQADEVAVALDRWG